MFDTWPTDQYSQTAFATWSQSPYFSQAQTFAQNYGIDPGFFTASIGAESGYNPQASNGGAQGIAQFMLPTAQQYGVNRYDPASSLAGSAKYFSDLLQSCNGDYVCASTKYGTLPSNGSALTENQELVLQTAINADTAAGIGTSVSGATGNILHNQTTCADLDFVCKLQGWVSQKGADILTIVAGLAILIVGIIMLRDSAGITSTVSDLTTKSIKRIGEAVAA